MIDVLFVGGGLANGLIAYRLAQARPHLRLLVLEAADRLGGRHTWSFHSSDLSPLQRDWLLPLVTAGWPAYEVRFPHRRRRLNGGYYSITSETFHERVAAVLGGRLRLGSPVSEVAPNHARLAGGEVVSARCVIDGRGLVSDAPFTLGYQKFVGRHLRLAAPHGLAEPVLMDATVDQIDGFRFVYVLPWDATSLLVEDTCYSDSPEIDATRLRAGIEAYVLRQGWTVASVLGEEQGVLPIPLAGDIERYLASLPRGVPVAGMRAALFHPTTGYSLPEAARLADALAARPDLESVPLKAWTDQHIRDAWRRGAFLRFLNRMLFRAAVPAERYRVLERFYGLSEGLVHRFYAGRLTWYDRVRLLTGKPPVPVLRAARCLSEERISA